MGDGRQTYEKMDRKKIGQGKKSHQGALFWSLKEWPGGRSLVHRPCFNHGAR